MSILEFIKILFNKDTRDAVGQAFDYFKRSPEWKSEVFTYSHTFTKSEKHFSDAYIEFILKILKEKGWSPEKITDIGFVSHELVNNAYIHGTSLKKLKVRIAVLITQKIFEITVKDNGRGFSLEKVLEKQQKIRHGLSYVKEIAISLNQKDSNSITANIPFDNSQLKTSEESNYQLLEFSESINTMSASKIKSQLTSFSAKLKANDKVIVDLSKMTFIDSVGMSILLTINRRLKEINCNYIFVMPDKDNPVHRLLELTNINVFLDHTYSIEQAKDALKIT